MTMVHIHDGGVHLRWHAVGRARWEDEAPLWAYGQSKAGGDAAVARRRSTTSCAPGSGDGKNFLKTWFLADQGTPSVVSDQVGRLTFTDPQGASFTC